MYVAKFVYRYYSVIVMAEKEEKKKVVALLSGGLDSTLAVKTMQKQGSNKYDIYEKMLPKQCKNDIQNQ